MSTKKQLLITNLSIRSENTIISVGKFQHQLQSKIIQLSQHCLALQETNKLKDLSFEFKNEKRIFDETLGVAADAHFGLVLYSIAQKMTY